MFKLDKKIFIFFLFILIIYLIIISYQYQKQVIWNEHVYLQKTYIPFVESIKYYNGEELHSTLKEFHKIEELSIEDAVLLIDKASREWSDWVQDMYHIIYLSDTNMPREDELYGYNGYIVGSEIQHDTLSMLNRISIVEYYFDSLKNKLQSGKLNRDDVLIIQEVSKYYNSIHETIINTWKEKLVSINYEIDMEYIQKIKEPFINSIVTDIKKLSELIIGIND